MVHNTLPFEDFDVGDMLKGPEIKRGVSGAYRKLVEGCLEFLPKQRFGAEALRGL